MSLAALAARHGGDVDEAARAELVERIAPLEQASAGALSPLLSRRYLEAALASSALLLVDASLAAEVPRGRRWVHPFGAWALAGLLAEIEESAPDRIVALDAHIAPGAVVMAGAILGPACIVEPNAVIYARVTLGARVRVGACAVIGRPGFGWVPGPNGELRRMPQLGGVRIEDDVDIGPLATIDAGT
ncbi:MAG TPA: hypothetical protein VGL13_06265, partial [Polyangiaceae bacterium]